MLSESTQQVLCWCLACTHQAEHMPGSCNNSWPDAVTMRTGMTSLILNITEEWILDSGKLREASACTSIEPQCHCRVLSTYVSRQLVVMGGLVHDSVYPIFFLHAGWLALIMVFQLEFMLRVGVFGGGGGTETDWMSRVPNYYYYIS